MKKNNGFALLDVTVAVAVISVMIALVVQLYGTEQQRMDTAEWISEVAELQSRSRGLSLQGAAIGAVSDQLHASIAPELVVPGVTPAQLAMRIGGFASLEVVERSLTVPVARTRKQMALQIPMSSTECLQSILQLGPMVHFISINGSIVLDLGNNTPFNAALALQGCSAETVITQIIFS